MVSLCEIWFQVVLILAAFVYKSECKYLEECFNKVLRDDATITLTCGNQLIKHIGIKYQRPGQAADPCCNTRSNCDWLGKCENKKSCDLPKPEVVDVLNCYLRPTQVNPVAVCIYYNCSKEEGSRSLPASDNPGNAGERGESSAVVAPIIVVLAILIIVAAIFGFVLYRRRRIRKCFREKSIEGPDIKGEENAGLDDAYNTIPADYGDESQHSFHVPEKDNADTDHKTRKYEEIKRGDSVNYCTIVLDENSKDESNDYGYDKTNQRKRNELSKVLGQDNLHSYGHFSEQTDDYNRIKSNVDNHLDKNYSHFESGDADDYSYLNDRKQDSNNISENDYNHLQTKSKPIRRVDSYEKQTLKDLSNVNNAGQYDISEIQNSEAFGEGDTDNKGVKRRDSYEDPVSIIAETTSAIKNESNEKLKPRDDYETPITLQTTTFSTSNESSSEVKRRDSYEEPVLQVSPDI